MNKEVLINCDIFFMSKRKSLSVFVRSPQKSQNRFPSSAPRRPQQKTRYAFQPPILSDK